MGISGGVGFLRLSSRPDPRASDSFEVKIFQMQVVILAGGLGTRLRSVAPNIPKALVPVAGRPFVYHQLERLKQQGFTDVLMCIGHLGEQIELELGDGTRVGMCVRYSRESEGALLGTGGALVNALPELQEEFLMMYGDSYLPVDFRSLVAWVREAQSFAAMSVYRNQGQWDHSNVRVEKQRVALYSKTALPGECDYIDYGLLYFQKNFISSYAGQPMPLDLSAMLRHLVEAHKLAAYEVHTRFYEIGKPEGLAELETHLRTRPHQAPTSP